jgi:hypothetical protein
MEMEMEMEMEMNRGGAFLCIWYKSIFFFSCRWVLC